jgi:hypothetical protein
LLYIIQQPGGFAAEYLLHSLVIVEHMIYVYMRELGFTAAPGVKNSLEIKAIK